MKPITNENDLIFTYTQKYITKIVKKNDEWTIKAINEYCKEHNIIPQIIEEEKLEEVLKLGIQALKEREIKGEDK